MSRVNSTIFAAAVQRSIETLLVFGIRDRFSLTPSLRFDTLCKKELDFTVFGQRDLYLVNWGCLKLIPCLQSPAYIKEGGDVKVSLDAPQKDFSTETTYDHNTNTIQYSTVNKFPPVKLLPNHERKRILGKCLSVCRIEKTLMVDGDDKLLVVPVSLVPTWSTDSCFSATRSPSSTTSSLVAGLP